MLSEKNENHKIQHSNNTSASSSSIEKITIDESENVEDKEDMNIPSGFSQVIVQIVHLSILKSVNE